MKPECPPSIQCWNNSIKLAVQELQDLVENMPEEKCSEEKCCSCYPGIVTLGGCPCKCHKPETKQECKCICHPEANCGMAESLLTCEHCKPEHYTEKAETCWNCDGKGVEMYSKAEIDKFMRELLDVLVDQFGDKYSRKIKALRSRFLPLTE